VSAAGLAGVAAANLIRGLRATLRVEHHGDEQIRRWEREGSRFVIAFWHRHLLLMVYSYRGRDCTVLISRSRDGELVARALHHLGFRTARGSSSRGGAAGLRELLRRAAAGSDVGFTPDGPRGPAGVVQPGVLLAAAALGWPIQPVAYAASRQRRLRSWDRMVVPLPFSRLAFAYGEPLRVERGADLELAGAELARRLDAAERTAAAVVGSSATEEEP